MGLERQVLENAERCGKEDGSVRSPVHCCFAACVAKLVGRLGMSSGAAVVPVTQTALADADFLAKLVRPTERSRS